ncbi:hypothetical protein F1715_11650, partial [Streptococcus pneumoniae]
VLLTLFVMQDKERILWLVRVVALSIAFYGVKGGLFTLRTGGAGMVFRGGSIEEVHQGPARGFADAFRHAGQGAHPLARAGRGSFHRLLWSQGR